MNRLWTIHYIHNDKHYKVHIRETSIVTALFEFAQRHVCHYDWIYKISDEVITEPNLLCSAENKNT